MGSDKSVANGTPTLLEALFKNTEATKAMHNKARFRYFFVVTARKWRGACRTIRDISIRILLVESTLAGRSRAGERLGCPNQCGRV